jgi:hypothetical protein
MAKTNWQAMTRNKMAEFSFSSRIKNGRISCQRQKKLMAEFLSSGRIGLGAKNKNAEFFVSTHIKLADFAANQQ